MGYGVQSCAKFGELYKDNPELTENLYFAWALGFMSALNAAAKTNGTQQLKNLSANSQDDQRYFLRNWCNEHPMADYGTAVVELLKSLPPVSATKP